MYTHWTYVFVLLDSLYQSLALYFIPHVVSMFQSNLTPTVVNFLNYTVFNILLLYNSSLSGNHFNTITYFSINQIGKKKVSTISKISIAKYKKVLAILINTCLSSNHLKWF